MKIVHVLVGKANPDSMNGVNKVVHCLGQEQVKAGYDVEIWGLSRSSEIPEQKHKYRLQVFPISKLRFLLCKELLHAIDQLPPLTWVQMHSVFIPEFFSIAHVLRRRNIRYGITPHGAYDPSSLRKNWLMKRLYIVLFEWRLLSNATCVQAVAESEIAHVRRITSQTDVVLVPNGHDMKLTEDVLVNIIPTNRPVFGFCGRLAATHKGLDLLIAGFATYKARGGGGVLWLVGDGQDMSELQCLAQRMGVAKNIIFFGPVYGQQKNRLLRNMDVFIHTSRWEGLPMSCLEAAALGKPLLVTKQTNLASYVERWGSGWVLPSNNSNEIALALCQCESLYINKDIDDKGDNARNMIENAFKWETHARQLANHWREYYEVS